jgi:hypothetical protein
MRSSCLRRLPRPSPRDLRGSSQRGVMVASPRVRAIGRSRGVFGRCQHRRVTPTRSCRDPRRACLGCHPPSCPPQETGQWPVGPSRTARSPFVVNTPRGRSTGSACSGARSAPAAGGGGNGSPGEPRSATGGKGRPQSGRSARRRFFLREAAAVASGCGGARDGGARVVMRGKVVTSPSYRHLLD